MAFCGGMPRRVLSVVAVAVLAVALLPWPAAIGYLDGVRTILTLAWWRRKMSKVKTAAARTTARVTRRPRRA